MKHSTRLHSNRALGMQQAMETVHEIWNLECEKPVYVKVTEGSDQRIGVNIKMDFKKQHLK